MSEDTYEIVTEGDAREFVEDSDGQALHLPFVPMVKELWFVQAGDEFAVVLLDDGNLSVSRPAGDDATIHNDGESIPTRVVDDSELPFDLGEIKDAFDAEQ